MFMADLLVPGGLGPLAGLACCSAMVGAAFAFRKKIPHPTECDLLGKCCLLCKCHIHRKFDLVISVHEGENVPKGSKVYLYVEAGRFDAQTQDARVDDATQKVDIHERLKLHVRQMEDVVKFSLYKSLTLSSECLGTFELNVIKDLMEEDFPSNRWYTFKKDDKNTSKIQISFTKLEGGADDLSPLLMQAMIQAQAEAAAKGQPFETINFAEMDPKERLTLLSKALEGPLKMMKGIGMKSWTPRYFRMVEAKPDAWEWHFWENKKACYGGKPKIGKIRMLGISNVLPDPANRHAFYVKYHDSKGTHDFMFHRVDRDRDVWADGLYEFLDRFRDYLEKYKPSGKKPDIAATALKKQEREKRLQTGMKRPSFQIDPTSRRVGVVKGKASDETVPKALEALAAEMYETDEGESDFDNVEEEDTSATVVTVGGNASSAKDDGEAGEIRRRRPADTPDGGTGSTEIHGGDDEGSTTHGGTKET